MTPMLGIMASSRLVASTAYESIATATGTGSSDTITFSSIPSTYTSLQIRFNVLTATTGSNIVVRFNSDTGANYSRHQLYGDGTTVTASGTASTTSFFAFGLTTSTTNPTVAIIDLHDYSSTANYKTARVLCGLDANGSGSIWLNSGSWRNTAAVTSVSITQTSSNAFGTGSTFALYGIKGA